MEWGDPCGEPVILGDPPAGQGFAYSPSGAVYECVRALSFQLKAAVAVANRVPVVSFLDGSGEAFAVAAAPFLLTSGLTARYSFFVGGNQYGANGAAHIGGPLPDLWLDMRSSVAVTIDGVNAGDQLSGARLYVVSRPVVADGDADG